MAPKGRGRQQSAPAATGTTAGSTTGGGVGDANANAGGTVGAGADNPSDDTSSSPGQPAAATARPRTRGSSEVSRAFASTSRLPQGRGAQSINRSCNGIHPVIHSSEENRAFVLTLVDGAAFNLR